jgi:hypothetical protein
MALSDMFVVELEGATRLFNERKIVTMVTDSYVANAEMGTRDVAGSVGASNQRPSALSLR